MPRLTAPWTDIILVIRSFMRGLLPKNPLLSFSILPVCRSEVPGGCTTSADIGRNSRSTPVINVKILEAQ